MINSTNKSYNIFVIISSYTISDYSHINCKFYRTCETQMLQQLSHSFLFVRRVNCADHFRSLCNSFVCSIFTWCGWARFTIHTHTPIAIPSISFSIWQFPFLSSLSLSFITWLTFCQAFRPFAKAAKSFAFDHLTVYITLGIRTR